MIGQSHPIGSRTDYPCSDHSPHLRFLLLFIDKQKAWRSARLKHLVELATRPTRYKKDNKNQIVHCTHSTLGPLPLLPLRQVMVLRCCHLVVQQACAATWLSPNTRCHFNKRRCCPHMGKQRNITKYTTNGVSWECWLVMFLLDMF